MYKMPQNGQGILLTYLEERYLNLLIKPGGCLCAVVYPTT